MMYTKEMQLRNNRTKTVRNFTEKIKLEIFERDRYKCVRCGTGRNLERVPHHIIFKSQGGTGEKRNGATVCMECHRKSHTLRKVREWFEYWRDKNLDEDGNKII